MLRPQKGNSGVSLNDTLLDFGLCMIVLEINRSLLRTIVNFSSDVIVFFYRVSHTIIDLQGVQHHIRSSIGLNYDFRDYSENLIRMNQFRKLK